LLNIAQNTAKPNEHIMAIRGTENVTEWLDDFTSVILVPLNGFGEVAYGFHRIYQTLRVVTNAMPQALDPQAPKRSLETIGIFADQVAAATRYHAAMRKPSKKSEAPDATVSIEVTGHSLGAALATLYVAENTRSRKVTTPQICTFGSPRVGDLTFAKKFDELGVTSWRIVNELDVVPKVPFLGFAHVEKEYLYNSGLLVNWSLRCWHLLETYLHLLDQKQPLLQECQPHRLSATAAARWETSLR
jgi:predicted lipase